MAYITPTAPPLPFESAIIHPHMMPLITPTTPPSPFPTAIIHPQYCAPYPVGLVLKKEKTILHKYTVTDINDNVIFTVTSPFLTMHQHRYVRDAHGNTILHLCRELFRDRWKAFRGQNMEQLEFFTRNVDVFLANNSTGVCDFKLVEAGFFARTWVVNIAESDIVVAQIKHKLGRFFKREKFMVTISPNIDYAFIVALTLTLDDYISRRRKRRT
ncbi:protein LURP-one-related 10-like [Arachis stenosperma]|uniref:protein LURP-one-related 10-like n=1 Tax=Arachis stenosperma TaxID=217475 RepID=UPI0025ABCAF6|nr:protein LURP-one-related 10-like [Arachis stenosperma]